MATLTIAGKSLDVVPATMGFLKFKLLPWKARMRAAATEEEVVDLGVEGLLLYIGHNDGIDAAWVLANVPEDMKATMEACRAAGGQAAAARAGLPGEAKSP